MDDVKRFITVTKVEGFQSEPGWYSAEDEEDVDPLDPFFVETLGPSVDDESQLVAPELRFEANPTQFYQAFGDRILDDGHLPDGYVLPYGHSAVLTHDHFRHVMESDVFLLAPKTGPLGVNPMGDLRPGLRDKNDDEVLQAWDQLWETYRHTIVSHLDGQKVASLGSALFTSNAYSNVHHERFVQLCGSNPALATMVDLVGARMGSFNFQELLALRPKALLSRLGASIETARHIGEVDRQSIINLGDRTVASWTKSVRIDSDHGFNTNDLKLALEQVIKVLDVVGANLTPDQVYKFREPAQWALFHEALLGNHQTLARKIAVDPAAAQRAIAGYFPDNIRETLGELATESCLKEIESYALNNGLGTFTKTGIEVTADLSFARLAGDAARWNTLVRQQAQVEAARNAIAANEKFNPSQADGFEFNGMVLRQLMSGEELDAHGEQMDNCVSTLVHSYACAAGDAQMFAVMKDDQLVATARLDRNYSLRECFGPKDAHVRDVFRRLDVALQMKAADFAPYEGRFEDADYSFTEPAAFGMDNGQGIA